MGRDVYAEIMTSPTSTLRRLPAPDPSFKPSPPFNPRCTNPACKSSDIIVVSMHVGVRRTTYKLRCRICDNVMRKTRFEVNPFIRP